MGNSEVGHLNLGAGRIVYQDLTRINKAIEEGELRRNRVLEETFADARGHRLHLLGLVSDGGVHSHYSHLIALANAARETGVPEILVHAFTDGRDASPTGGADYLKICTKELQKSRAQIVTVVGRYFAMDRDRRWDRTKKAWDAIVLGRGESCKSSPAAAVDRQYKEGKTDEFMPPLIFSYPNEQRVRDGDTVMFFNFRADRARQLSQAFLLKDFDGFDREVWPQVHFVSLTQYDVTYASPFIFAPAELPQILGEVVSAAGESQLRIAETEKYPHVTYFFNGGIERAFPGEDRKIIPSPKVATYDLQPEMSARAVTDEALARMADCDLIILNFANPDMVGHTGVLGAAIKAVETVAATDSTVLITGETGTGKELIARAIHHLSNRKDRVLVKVNCSAIPAGLIESELFGHERGAFTGALARKTGRFELADGATIFLDEIGDLPLDLQAKLLRVLQEGEFERLGSTRTMKVNVRVIAATNRDLDKAMQEGGFRSDLYYRLNVFPIHLPALRERKADIPLLVGYFAKRYGVKMGKKIETIPQTTIQAIQSYSWPGNVRELENVIERAVILSQGSQLDLGEWLPKPGVAPVELRAATLEEMERAHILEALERTGWRVSGEKGAAKLLGLKPTTLEARMKKLGITRKAS